MRLYLAVAVLMLALVAFTEAQEETIEERFTRLGEQITEAGKSFAEKAKTAFQDIHDSDFAAQTRTWFTEGFEKFKAKVAEMS